MSIRCVDCPFFVDLASGTRSDECAHPDNVASMAAEVTVSKTSTLPSCAWNGGGRHASMSVKVEPGVARWPRPLPCQKGDERPLWCRRRCDAARRCARCGELACRCAVLS